MIESAHLEELIELRHQLHQQPELSGQETATINRLCEYLDTINPEIQKERIGRGLLAIFNGAEPGPTTLIRAELDALPIQEESQIAYKSSAEGISHKCGHDGHMCMVAGLARLLNDQPPKQGWVVLLFQSAEETGQGARWMLNDPNFKKYQPDYVFALHNLPGYPLGQVLLKSGTFCAASTGMKISMQGKTAHASHPETGTSPAIALARISSLAVAIPQADAFTDYVLTTLTHMQLGEPTFGVSPGAGELWLTLRAYRDKDLELLKSLIKIETERIVLEEGLGVTFSYHEAFEATTNHTEEVNLVDGLAKAAGLEVRQMESPNRWSEDFGLFLQQSKGAMFGLGAGIDQPALHNPDYDFPDELIEKGLMMFWGIVRSINS